RPARRRAGDAVDPARRGGLPAVRRPGPWPPWGSTEGRCVGVIISRRTLLVGGLAASLGLTGCAGATESPEQTARLLPSGAPLPDRFTRPFVVPPVKRPVDTAAGVTRYEIVQRAAELEILPGLRTEIMGYDGLLPGPTIKARRGERVVVRQRNELTVPTVTHLHGGHTP